MMQPALGGGEVDLVARYQVILPALAAEEHGIPLERFGTAEELGLVFCEDRLNDRRLTFVTSDAEFVRALVDFMRGVLANPEIYPEMSDIPLPLEKFQLVLEGWPAGVP